MIAHELRTPLTGILGSVQLLRQCRIPSDGEPQDAYLDLIEANAAHLSDLIERAFDPAGPEVAGRSDVELQAVPIASACSGAVKLVAPLARSKQLSVELEIDPAVVWVRAEPCRLRQILGNLLSNAVKFTPVSGRIGLRVTRGLDPTRAVLDVWDSGPGLTSEEVARLEAFEPYTRLLRGAGNEPEGMGLGLSIVKRLVDLHEGRLSIHSARGEGCRFRVEIPLASPETFSGPQSDEDPSTGIAADAIAPAGLRVLIVDDVAGNLLITSAYLTNAGFDVKSADSARGALDVLRATPVDVLVCDLRMPDMDGVALAKIIRSEPRYAKLSIIALTASVRPEDRRRCLAAGMSDYLMKPVSLSRLAASIARHGREARAERPPPQSSVRVDESAARILHDINDALGVAIGNLDLALNGTGPCDAAQLRDALESCLRIADLLKHLQRQRGTIGPGEARS